MPKDVKEIKAELIIAGKEAAEDLIRVAKEKIVTKTKDPLAADKLKNAAAAKKMAIFDAFDILERVQQEENNLKDDGEKGKDKEVSGEGVECAQEEKKIDFGRPEQRTG